MCVYTRSFDVEWSLIIARVQRYSTWYIPRDATMFGSGNQFSLEKFSSIFPTYSVPGRGIKMSLDDLRLRNRSINRFRFQFIALDIVGSLSFYGANSCSFRSQSFHFVTLSPRLIRGEIVTLRHSPLP